MAESKADAPKKITVSKEMSSGELIKRAIASNTPLDAHRKNYLRELLRLGAGSGHWLPPLTTAHIMPALRTVEKIAQHGGIEMSLQARTRLGLYVAGVALNGMTDRVIGSRAYSDLGIEPLTYTQVIDERIQLINGIWRYSPDTTLDRQEKSDAARQMEIASFLQVVQPSSS